MEIIKIALVDDHSIFSKGLSLLLNEVAEFKVIGEAVNGEDFLNKLPAWNPDIVLMDIKMPVMDGIKTTSLALAKQPNLKIIALTMFGESHYCRSMAEAGASGFVQKNISGNELEKAIKNVMKGETYFSDSIKKDISSSGGTELLIEEYNEKLTEREFEVLTYIVKGLSAHEIAEKMFISSRTVEGHRANLISKTGSRNVVELVIYAIRNHLIEL
jgi:DNA-binding NarL/FixJ family response regulator